MTKARDLADLISNSSVDTSEITDAAITTNKLADDAVTAAKLKDTDSFTVAGLTSTGNINFGDNDKAIFGAGSDLQIYHDGLNSYVEDTATGSLILKGADVVVKDSSNNDIAKFLNGGAAQLRYAGAIKLATTSTGVDITGTLTSDGLIVNAGASGNFGAVISSATQYSSDALRLQRNGVAAQGMNITAGGETVIFDSQNTGSGGLHSIFEFKSTDETTTKNVAKFNGKTNDISFYEDTGTTPKFFWDASAENLYLANTNPVLAGVSTGVVSATSFTVGGQTSGADSMYIRRAAAANYQLQTTNTGSSSGEIHLQPYGGNVGIGTSSITSGFKMEVVGGARFGDVAGDDAVELGWSVGGSQGFIQAYDRGASAFRQLSINNAITISSSGNVGIGTSSPTNGKLEVTHASSTVPAGFFRNTSGSGDSPSLTVQGGANNAAPNFSVLDYNGTTDFVVQGAGNVGIGTSSPSAPLTIRSFGATGRAAEVYGSNVLLDGVGAFDLIMGDGAVAYMSLSTTDNATALKIRNYSGDSDIATFERTTGNVGIGTSSPSQKLTVGFADNGTDGISFRSSNYANLAKILVQNETSTQNGNLQFHTRSGGSVNEAMRIDSSGHAIIPAGVTLGTAAGVYAAANTLDDYEEGTHDLIVYGSVSGTKTFTYNGSVQGLRYTKIGNKVFCELLINNQSLPTYTGDLRFSLPYTSAGGAFESISGDLYFYPVQTWDSYNNFTGLTSRLGSSNNHLSIGIKIVDTDRQIILGHGNSNTSGATVYLRFSFSYTAA